MPLAPVRLHVDEVGQWQLSPSLGRNVLALVAKDVDLAASWIREDGRDGRIRQGKSVIRC